MMDKNTENLSQLKAFDDTIEVEGFTYYDNYSRSFCIFRLPAVMKHLFPQLKKSKCFYKCRCPPTFEKLDTIIERLKQSSEVPIILSLYERDKK